MMPSGMPAAGIDPGFDLASHAGQDAAALDGCGATPVALEGGAGGPDGGVYIAGGSGGQGAQDLARRRVVDGQGRAAARRAPGAADEDLIGRKGRDHQSKLTIIARRRERRRSVGMIIDYATSPLWLDCKPLICSSARWIF